LPSTPEAATPVGRGSSPSGDKCFNLHQDAGARVSGCFFVIRGGVWAKLPRRWQHSPECWWIKTPENLFLIFENSLKMFLTKKLKPVSDLPKIKLYIMASSLELFEYSID
jgi:hypothetical protein